MYYRSKNEIPKNTSRALHNFDNNTTLNQVEFSTYMKKQITLQQHKDGLLPIRPCAVRSDTLQKWAQKTLKKLNINKRLKPYEILARIKNSDANNQIVEIDNVENLKEQENKIVVESISNKKTAVQNIQRVELDNKQMKSFVEERFQKLMALMKCDKQERNEDYQSTQSQDIGSNLNEKQKRKMVPILRKKSNITERTTSTFSSTMVGGCDHFTPKSPLLQKWKSTKNVWSEPKFEDGFKFHHQYTSEHRKEIQSELFRRESLTKIDILHRKEIIMEQESISDNHSSERNNDQEDCSFFHQNTFNNNHLLSYPNELFSFCQPHRQSNFECPSPQLKSPLLRKTLLTYVIEDDESMTIENYPSQSPDPSQQMCY